MSNLSFYSFHSDDAFCALLPQVKADKVQEEGGIKRVTMSPPIIDGMKRGSDSSIKCRGFLEEWLAKNKHVRDDTVGKLIIDVKNFIS